MMKHALYKPKMSNTAVNAANKKMNEVVKYEAQFIVGIDKYLEKYGIVD